MEVKVGGYEAVQVLFNYVFGGGVIFWYYVGVKIPPAERYRGRRINIFVLCSGVSTIVSEVTLHFTQNFNSIYLVQLCYFFLPLFESLSNGRSQLRVLIISQYPTCVLLPTTNPRSSELAEGCLPQVTCPTFFFGIISRFFLCSKVDCEDTYKIKNLSITVWHFFSTHPFYCLCFGVRC